MKLLILPNDIDLDNVGIGSINETAIYQIAENAGVESEYDDDGYVTEESRDLLLSDPIISYQLLELIFEVGQSPVVSQQSSIR